jgi:hypothetical protein
VDGNNIRIRGDSGKTHLLKGSQDDHILTIILSKLTCKILLVKIGLCKGKHRSLKDRGPLEWRVQMSLKFVPLIDNIEFSITCDFSEYLFIFLLTERGMIVDLFISPFISFYQKHLKLPCLRAFAL